MNSYKDTVRRKNKQDNNTEKEESPKNGEENSNIVQTKSDSSMEDDKTIH